MITVQNFVGGEFKAPLEESWREVREPATGEIITKAPESDLMDLVTAIQASNKAWTNWQKTTPSERSKLLRSLAEKMRAREADLTKAQAQETGEPVKFTRQSVSRAIAQVEFHAEASLQATEPGLFAAEFTAATNRQPLGVVALILPWTDPLGALVSRLAPALASGNVVIAKPSSMTPLTLSLFSEVVAASGLPNGVFNCLHGSGSNIGQALIQHPGISTIALIGSTETGRVIQREASELLKKTHLALSGRNSVLVFQDFDFNKQMSRLIKSCLLAAQPSCLRGSRVFVQESIYDKFLEVLTTEVGKLKIGDPLDEQTDLGPLVSAKKKERFEASVTKALGEKGKALLGGVGQPENLDARLVNGNFVRPTAVFDLTNCSTLQQEEIEGPFLTISSFKYQHDALKHANTSPLGLAAYIYEPQGAKAMRVAQKTEASRVFVNSNGAIFDPRLSFGAMKQSGVGRSGALELERFFSKESLIVHDHST
jgi:aminomuconate-semialdehyde/2-hydroxymuconate-6-semialdehyde dehydrogenase